MQELFFFADVGNTTYAFQQQKERRMYIFCGNVRVSAAERAWVLQIKAEHHRRLFFFGNPPLRIKLIPPIKLVKISRELHIATTKHFFDICCHVCVCSMNYLHWIDPAFISNGGHAQTRTATCWNVQLTANARCHNE